MTISESLAAGLPLLLINPYPLQEEANANALLENGAAVRIDPLSTFALKLRRLLEDRERLATMRSAALLAWIVDTNPTNNKLERRRRNGLNMSNPRQVGSF